MQVIGYGDDACLAVVREQDSRVLVRRLNVWKSRRHGQHIGDRQTIQARFSAGNRRIPGKRYREPTPCSHLALYRDPSVVQFGQVAHQGQPQPCAGMLPRQAAVQLHKGLKQHAHLVF